MRTAQAVVLLAGGARPKSQAVLAEARTQLTDLAGTEPSGGVRFVGYDATLRPAGVPTDVRVAVYEADFDHVTATTLANVASTLRPARVI
jgi:outer membrane protein TolC